MKKSLSVILSAVLFVGMTSCSGKESMSESSESRDFSENSQNSESSEAVSEEITVSETEPITEHVSPVETVTASLGIQQTVDTTIEKTEGSNTIKLPLADFMQEGDKVNSFTFVIYSADDSNIGEFKGGCGISVTSDCSAATDDGWYQSENFTSPTEGTYGEVTWNVPGDVSDFISPSGELLFGYWWGNSSSIRIESVICNLTRTRDIPCDGTVTQQVGKSVGYNDSDNTIRVNTNFSPGGSCTAGSNI